MALTLHAPDHVLSPADTTTAGWAAAHLADLVRHVGPSTAAGMVLRQAQRELESLAGPVERPVVVGPLKIARPAA